MPILAKEVDLYPDDLLTLAAREQEAFTAGEYASQWWAVYTRSRQEKALMRRLRELEVPFYGPTISRRTRTARRVRTTYMPLFPNYVFVFGTAEQRLASLTTNCVSRCVPVHDGRELTRDLEQIHRLILTGAALTPEARIMAGDRVRVRSGPFAGFEGLVCRRQNEMRLLVAVEFMQQGASVLLEDCQLEMIGRASGK